MELLPRIKRKLRCALGVAPSGLHLNEHHFTLVQDDEVDLAVQRAVIPLQNLSPCLLKNLASRSSHPLPSILLKSLIGLHRAASVQQGKSSSGALRRDHAFAAGTSAPWSRSLCVFGNCTEGISHAVPA